MTFERRKNNLIVKHLFYTPNISDDTPVGYIKNHILLGSEMAMRNLKRKWEIIKSSWF